MESNTSFSSSGEITLEECKKQNALLEEKNRALSQEIEVLRIEKEKARSFFSNNPNPSLIWNSDLRIIDVNDAFVNGTGYSRERVLSMSLNDFVYLDRKGDGIQETLRDKKMKTGEATFQFPKGVVLN